MADGRSEKRTKAISVITASNTSVMYIWAIQNKRGGTYEKICEDNHTDGADPGRSSGRIPGNPEQLGLYGFAAGHIRSRRRTISKASQWETDIPMYSATG